MSASGCDYVSRYLDRFLEEGARSGVDLEQVGAHVGTCTDCYRKLSHFFRTIELPESKYLEETIDELALALYNLAKAVIRDRPAADADDVTDNVRITVPGGGSADENAKAGMEMIADAEDFTGSSRVGSLDLDEVRSELEGAAATGKRRTDLALSLFHRLTTLQSRYLPMAWNWIGVLHLQRRDLDAAEAAFLKVLSGGGDAQDVRSYAHCNLAYVFKHRNDLDRAIRSAQRSVIYAEEDGKDAYFGRFAEMYFRLLRDAPGDAESARILFDRLVGTEDGRRQLVRDLRVEPNAPVLEVFRRSALARLLPEL